MAWDRATLTELFDYTDFTWTSYGKTLATLPPDAITRPLEGGWGNVRRALIHIALAWDNWAYERTGLTIPGDFEDNTITSWSDLEAHRARVRTLMRGALDGISDAELVEKNVTMWKGTPAENLVSPGDVLAHILLHERGHHGDVSTLLSQLGASPPGIDYLVYRFFKSRQPA
jgi:uncharacterized damage-inducible protein DinB